VTNLRRRWSAGFYVVRLHTGSCRNRLSWRTCWWDTGPGSHCIHPRLQYKYTRKRCQNSTRGTSGVFRILERGRRREGWSAVGFPIPLKMGSGRGCAPSQKIFQIFSIKMACSSAFWNTVNVPAQKAARIRLQVQYLEKYTI